MYNSAYWGKNKCCRSRRLQLEDDAYELQWIQTTLRSRYHLHDVHLQRECDYTDIELANNKRGRKLDRTCEAEHCKTDPQSRACFRRAISTTNRSHSADSRLEKAL